MKFLFCLKKENCASVNIKCQFTELKHFSCNIMYHNNDTFYFSENNLILWENNSGKSIQISYIPFLKR